MITPEGIRNFQKQKPTALRAGIGKFAESVGGKLEVWCFDFANHIGWGIIDYPDDVSAAAAIMTTQAAGFANVTLTPLITAEEADKAFEKSAVTRPPQQQWNVRRLLSIPIDPGAQMVRAPGHDRNRNRMNVGDSP